MRHRYPLRSESVELLLHLANFGTCSAKTLAWMTQRHPARVRRNIESLNRDGLVTKLSLSIEGNPAVHCQLAQNPRVRELMSRLSGLPPEHFHKKGFPITQLRHEDLCAKLHYRIAKAHPEILVIRDWQIPHKPIPDRVLPKRFHRERMLPDLILGIPSNKGDAAWSAGGLRWVAVELDRVRKKLGRVREKLHIYAKETQFDGLLYIFPERLLADDFGDFYDRKVAPNAIRIRDYKDAFLARSVLGEENQDLSLMRLRCGKSLVGFESWIRLLGSTSSHTRAAAWTQLVDETSTNTKNMPTKQNS